MNARRARESGYRWLVLAAFMLVTIVNQASWITFAPVTGEASRYYGTTDLMIGLLSMVFMVIYVLIVIPSAWLIDTLGFRKATTIGALLTAAFAVLRGVFSSSYPLVMVSQIGIAVGQPLILGSITQLSARWFPIRERATATGFGTLAIYVGILAAMFLTPPLTAAYAFPGMLRIYGVCALIVAAVFLAVGRDFPGGKQPPAGERERLAMFAGLKSMLRNRDFILLLIIFFIGLGMFNGITTWIEAIVRPRGFSAAQAGVAGGLMLVGGIVGGVVVPVISDARRRRKPFIILALIGLLPGLLGLTYGRSFLLLLTASFLFGFFLLSAGPIGFQYGAEITHPGPEGTSNSLLLVMGQLSGIVFILGMDAFKRPSGSMTASMLVLLALTAAAAALSFLLRESPISKARA